MKRISLFICSLFFSVLCFAQGTVWEELSLQEALSKAEKQGKKVFIDCYTKTCGPCKYMLKNIFTLQKCGEYFNRHYVCITRDVEEGEGIDIAKNYKVFLCPTYLILNTDGTLFTRLDGGAVSSPKEDFVGKVKDAVRLGEMHVRYGRGERDETFLKEYRKILFEKDRMLLEKVMNETMLSYSVKELAEPENWQMIKEAVNQSDSPLFQLIVKNRKSLFRRIGEEEVKNKIMGTYMYDFLMRDAKGTDYNKFYRQISVLVEEGFPNALPLQYAILCRKMCQEQKCNDMDQLLNFLPEFGSKVPDIKNQMMVVKEISKVHKYCTAEQKKAMIDMFHRILPDFGEKVAGRIQQAILKFEK